MSYVIGWKDDDNVYLSADTLMSSEGNINYGEPLSATGENLQSVTKGTANDIYLKIWIIKDMAVGFVSNRSTEATLFLSDLEFCYDPTDRVNSIESLLSTYNPEDTQFLFAFYEDGPQLYKYDPDYDELINEEFTTQIGSLPIGFQVTTEDFVDHVIEEEPDLSADDKLVLVNSVHQQILIQHDALSFGVGGVFTGLYISGEGVHWQKDTVLYNYNYDHASILPDLSNIEACITPKTMTMLIPRDPFVMTHSGFDINNSRTNKLFSFALQPSVPRVLSRHLDERRTWLNRFNPEFDQLIQCPDADYFVFYSAQQKNPPNLHIIRSHNGNPYVNISCLKDDGFYNIDINMGLFRAFHVNHSLRQFKYEFVN